MSCLYNTPKSVAEIAGVPDIAYASAEFLSLIPLSLYLCVSDGGFAVEVMPFGIGAKWIDIIGEPSEDL